MRKQDDEVDSAASGDLCELPQQSTRQSLRALALVDTQVDNSEDTHNFIVYPEHTKLDAHLGDDPRVNRRH